MFRKLLLASAILSLAACGGANTSEHENAGQKPAAAQAEKPHFDVLDAYVRAPLDGKTITAAYFTVASHTENPASILAVTTPDAGSAELHSHVMDSKTMSMSMRKVDFIDIPANGTAQLKPMGDHVMLFDVREGLKDGDTVHLELTILDNGSPTVLTVDAPVKTL